MGDLTGKFAAFETLTEEQHASLMTLLGEISTTLGNVESALDIQINNAATNTKYLLAAINQNSPCAPCPMPALVVPTIPDTGTGVNDEKCQRTQAFLHALEQVYGVADVMSSFGIGFNPTTITDAINQVIEGFDTGDTPNVMSWPEANATVNYAILYGISNFLVGGTLVGYFAIIRDAAQSAIYSADSIPADVSAYTGVLNASEIPADARALMSSLAWFDLWNYYFSEGSTPNLEPFDGAICTPEECIELTSTLTTYPGPVQGSAIWWTGDFNGSNCTPAAYCADGPAWLDEDRVGWTLIAHGPCDVFVNWNFASTHLEADEVMLLPNTTFMAIQNYPSTAEFSVTLCPPTE